MSVTIKLDFPAGRYHATPWGRHVNEGVPEWPPSPWRLLRALVAVWRRTCSEIPQESVRRALEPLMQPPCFRLPSHRVAHTRHYMPWEKKNPNDRTLVFDTFVVLSRSESVFVSWIDATLPPSDLATLSKLLSNLTTLGRAEGWVEASIWPEPIEPTCTPLSQDSNPVSVFCPDPATAFGSEFFPKHDAKSLKKGLRPNELLFDCPPWHLCLDTQTIHAERWPSVPGATWVNYDRPVELVARPRARRNTTTPTLARFILDGPVLPKLTDTIRVADAFRNAAMSQFQHWCRMYEGSAGKYRRSDDPSRFASPTLTGKDADGNLLDGNVNAYYLPTSSDNLYLTHLDVFVRNGIGEPEFESLSRVREVRIADSLRVRTQLVDAGEARVMGGTHYSEASEWVSTTPFLGPNHIGRAGQLRFLRKSLNREWRRLSSQVAAYHDVRLLKVEPLLVEAPEWKRPKPVAFRRVRFKHRHSGYRPPAIYKLVFSKPIPGPICLGYGSHFGMGSFRPLR